MNFLALFPSRSLRAQIAAQCGRILWRLGECGDALPNVGVLLEEGPDIRAVLHLRQLVRRAARRSRRGDTDPLRLAASSRASPGSRAGRHAETRPCPPGTHPSHRARPVSGACLGVVRMQLVESLRGGVQPLEHRARGVAVDRLALELPARDVVDVLPHLVERAQVCGFCTFCGLLVLPPSWISDSGLIFMPPGRMRSAARRPCAHRGTRDVEEREHFGVIDLEVAHLVVGGLRERLLLGRMSSTSGKVVLRLEADALLDIAA
jgi:hypothetical protein